MFCFIFILNKIKTKIEINAVANKKFLFLEASTLQERRFVLVAEQKDFLARWMSRADKRGAPIN